ncbi:hypothetical protein L210DRAFT_3551679 [Boletus edulis BED1]|uniref:Uncharacterized protein n=1 Tax=Boletus edulis BED1 TaxID=1328754 RepID=A0AAD4BMB5_BOLED|nr:hypothetical protein L210DRAFT_3551679 [Boletus edulis BED1]
MKEEIEGCNTMLPSLRRERLECLAQHRTEEFFLKLEQSQRLQSHLDDLKKSVEDRRISSQTRAVAKRTGYHGFVDWAERISRTHENVLQTTAQVGFVGAGLTYGSIFSASRGNIGLMCYAFALFVCGFIIPTVALALLKWASLRPKDTVFTSPYTWTLALNISTYASVAAVGSAICLLNLTLYLLSFPLDASGQQEDPHLQFSISPSPAGSVSLGGLSLAVGIALFCVITHYVARGWDAFVHDFLRRYAS